jgi:hypothetical protein
VKVVLDNIAFFIAPLHCGTSNSTSSLGYADEFHPFVHSLPCQMQITNAVPCVKPMQRYRGLIS